ncbi:hypothetical protein ABZ319_16390 [Nocardia sp. NPDC005978]|uniref:hypothetical protein n=1 Tax=Nocardia sp. NPDC005978 TaxID=3156725 RepID=UPI0033ACAD7B
MSSSCRYCRHHTAHDSRDCENCGAPTTVNAGAVLTEVAALAAPLRQARVFAEHVVPRQWIVAVIIGVVLLGGVAVAVHAIGDLRPTIWHAPGHTTLPPTLEDAADCAEFDHHTSAERCVIAGNSPLLKDLTGGQRLVFEVRPMAPDVLASTLQLWRATGSVVADGETFAAVGPTATVWYANTATGTRMDTGRFSSGEAARQFLSRAGLVTTPGR